MDRTPLSSGNRAERRQYGISFSAELSVLEMEALCLNKLLLIKYTGVLRHTEITLHCVDFERRWGCRKGHRPPKMALELKIRMWKFGSHRSVAHFRGLTGVSCLAEPRFKTGRFRSPRLHGTIRAKLIETCLFRHILGGVSWLGFPVR